MDQFSHDLTVALMEETSLLDRARVSRWGQRRRTRSTGNLPCAPQPTEKEDSSSSPTDMAAKPTNVDGLDTHNVTLPTVSDSDDKELRLPCKSAQALNASIRLGTLESDSLNETFSPARFFKPNARRKRKLKRMSMEYEISASASQQGAEYAAEASAQAVALATAAGLSGSSCGTLRKRVLKPEPNSRSNLFFCGKRKRSNRDRYHDHHDTMAKAHSTSMPRYTYMEEHRMRPRSYSSTSKPHSDRLLPLNKGLVSKIEKIAQLQKTDAALNATVAEASDATTFTEEGSSIIVTALATIAPPPPEAEPLPGSVLPQQQPQQPLEQNFQGHRKKSGRARRRSQLQQLQFTVDQHPMDCGELNDFLSSSSLSSSESDDAHTANDTDREGDDELTDWPGNEGVSGPHNEGGNGAKYDPKRRQLTKKSNSNSNAMMMPGKSDDLMMAGTMPSTILMTMAEDDTLMSGSGDWSAGSEVPEAHEIRYQPSEPITIINRSFDLSRNFGLATAATAASAADSGAELSIPCIKQIESEMSGETSNPFMPSPPCQPAEVREIRAGCRRVKEERPGFSIKTSVNERLARFLQDARQTKIRLPDVEIYEHESLLNLATLYSLNIALDNGCAVLTKTSNTTQSVNIDQQSLQNRLFLSDFKRRCYDSKEANSFLPRK